MQITITRAYEAVSPKTFVKALYTIPHFKILKLIKANKIQLNGSRILKETILKENDIITIPEELDHFKKEIKKIENIDHNIPLIFENEDFLVINKPKNMPVNEESTLTEHLGFLSEKNNSDFIYKPCHRLDKNTAGLLLIAKNLKALSDLQTKFQNKEITKIYEATCIGKPPEEEGTLKYKLARDEHITIVAEEGKEKITEYKVIDTFTKENIQLAKVEVNLITGFTHQIRVHFAELGNPLLGDDMYGNVDVNTELNLHTQELIAKKVAFEYKKEKFSITL
jgi:RluA family pseudouridine synthase